MSNKVVKPEDVINFWFVEISPEFWFKKDEAFDQRLIQNYSDCYWAASRGELSHWRNSAEGRLAEIIVLDQFARNMFRGQAQAFLYDNLALILAQEAINLKLDEPLIASKKAFMYMPFMHSESPLIHQQAVKLFSQPGLENNLNFEHKHFDIIKQFGRYPHRNETLGRQSSEAEIEFLSRPGSSF